MKERLPPVCHPERTRPVGKLGRSQRARKRAPLFVLIGAFVLGVALWPVPLTQGHVPPEERLSPIAAKPKTPVTMPAATDLAPERAETVRSALQTAFHQANIRETDLLRLQMDDESGAASAVFYLPRGRAKTLAGLLEKRLLKSLADLPGVSTQLSTPMETLLTLKIQIDGKLAHDLTFYFPAGEEARKSRSPSFPGKKQPAAPSGKQPKVAIVIDDLGEDQSAVEALLRMDAPLTLSILPGSPFGVNAAKRAPQFGKEVFLHVPMEPEKVSEINRPFYLLTRMRKEQITMLFEKQLASIPNVSGVNNHMGSRFTKDYSAMETALGVLAKHRLPFLDSRTSDQTVGYDVARSLGLTTGVRDVFLDHNPRLARVEGQFALLRQIAKRNGQAIAIGHPHSSTMRLLPREIARLKREGFQIVPATKLLR